MTWSQLKQKQISPDFNVIDKILQKLNGVFDAYDFFHHSSSIEMFEFTYQKDDYRREAWQIKFMGKVVASGGGFGLSYDEFYEDDYIFITEENADLIYNTAFKGAVGTVSDALRFVSYSDIDNSYKDEWIHTIESGIKRVEEDKKDVNRHWESDEKLI